MEAELIERIKIYQRAIDEIDKEKILIINELDVYYDQEDSYEIHIHAEKYEQIIDLKRKLEYRINLIKMNLVNQQKN